MMEIEKLRPAMVCLYCGRKIGWLRRPLDREFCCGSHRKIARASSARSLRDAGYYYGEEPEAALVTPMAHRSRSGAPGGGFLALVLLFVLALLWFPKISPTAMTSNEARYVLRSGGMWNRLRQLIPDTGKTIDVGADFRGSMQNWIGTPGSSARWAQTSGTVKPAGLRLWKPSLQLTDYRFDFQTQIEHKAVGWVFRASDVKNYYAAKIVVTKPHPFPVSSIVRYAVVNGRPQGRTELPLPSPVRQGTVYQVSVNVKADIFTTLVNGQEVDKWRDKRLKAGGIGFFTEKGESASILSVQLSHGESWLSRLFAAWFFVRPPVGLP